MGWIKAQARWAVGKLRQYGTLVMFSHTIFSLSFGLVALLIASGGRPPWAKLVWILVALLAARTGANALNRVIDAQIDARNPRTASRQLPRGELRHREALAFSVVCFVVFAVAAAQFNPLCLALTPVALALMVGYSYTKRFTWACHLILGLTTACAPVGAWLAITGAFSWPALFLGGANLLWVAGFDVIYGAQDEAFDRENGLHSMAVRFGVEGALRWSSWMHVGAVGCLGMAGLLLGLGPIFWVGLIAIAALLVAEHRIVSPGNLANVKIASYGINQIVSVVLLMAGVLDVYL